MDCRNDFGHGYLPVPIYFTERKKVFAINRKEADKGKTVCVQETLFCIEGVADQNESEKQQSG